MAKKVTMTPEQLLEKLKGSLTDDQMAAARRLSGQDAQGGGTSTPKVVICTLGAKDPSGKKVAKGNFAIFQKTTYDPTTNERGMVEAGVDLGDNPQMTILKVGTQFSYMKGNDRCSSQICTERNEVAVGSKLRHQCGSSCPLRKDGSGKDGKGKACKQQFVLFLELPDGVVDLEGNPAKHAIFYGKGINYKPVQKYLNEVLKPATDGLGFFAVKTAFATEDAGTYFDLELEVGEPNVDTYMDLLEQSQGIDRDLVEFKASNAVKPNQKALPAPTDGEKEDPFKNADMGEVKEGEVLTGNPDDDIPF